jgi:imidazolonepropionase-like amidohydrolase
MPKLTLLRGARQLLTLRGPAGPRRGTELRNLGIIQDGAVLISDASIAEVGPTRRLENLSVARDAEEIDASGCVVLPGFVDSGVTLIRGVAEHSPRALQTLALQRIEEAVRCGTTALEAVCGPNLAEAAALKALRVHAALRELPLTLVSTVAFSGPRLLAAPRIRRLADFAEISIEDPALLSDARRAGWNLKPHPVAVLNPLPSFLKQEGNPPARSLIDGGDAVALASGGANMQMAIALACRAMNMIPAEAIAAATINGACAIGRSPSVGSLEAGKDADLLILGVPDYRELPYHLGVNLVNLVMIRGVVRVRKSEVLWR